MYIERWCNVEGKRQTILEDDSDLEKSTSMLSPSCTVTDA